jgi:RHS repeat-associated protein
MHMRTINSQCLLGYLLCCFIAAATHGAPAELQITGRGPHHRTWQRVVQASRPDGTAFLKTNSYIQLENGVHYQNANGEWIESEETIDVVNGIGLAEKGLHKATFPANVRTAGGIDLLTADGKRLRSHVMCLAYTDARTGQSVLIAEPKDAIGEVAGNVVTYPDAFTDFIADVRYTYTKAGLEQDIIFFENPPSPAEYGLDPETTRIEVFTEFLEAPVPSKNPSVLVEESDPVRRQEMLEPDLTDEYLSFGLMAIGLGRAFPANVPANEENSVPVGKEWTVINQRTFLIEKVDYRSVRGELQNLPQAAALRRPAKRARRDVMLAQLSNGGTIWQGGGLELAQARQARKGFVLDYQIVSSATNFTFKADTTYFVTNNFTLSETTVIEGGSVVKYSTNTLSGPKLLFSGPIDCQTGPGRPAFFVGKNDDTVGEVISGSTGDPGASGRYAFKAFELNFSGTTFDLHDLRIRNAYYAIYANSGSKLVLRNSQIGWGHAVIVNNTEPLRVQNALIHNMANGISSTAYTSHVENVTFHRVGTFWGGASVDRVRLTNCLIICVTNSVIFGGANVVTNLDDTGFFQTVGAGARYLANGSTNRQSGTTNITPSLLADLRKRTTYPPVVLSNDITTTTILGVQATRGSGLPDLGYAYDPLDFVVSGIDVTAALTIQPGTVIGTYGAASSYGFEILEGGSVVCEGTVTDPCRFTRYNLVQEQANSTWAASSCGYTFIAPDSVGVPYPSARFRFAEFSMPAAGAEHFYVGFGDYPPAVFVDCQFGGGRLLVDYAGATFTNCLFERVDSGFFGNIGRFQNNLFYGGSASFAPADVNPFYISDNVFDKTTISQLFTLTHHYNGYITNLIGQVLTNGAGHDIFTNAFTYQAGPFGRYYQSTNSPFVGIGSTNADILGLYQFTVLTNNVKETNSVVDIGFHRVAVGTDGLPLDSDGDGIGDCVEDLNGNGITDGAEGSFANPVLIIASPIDYLRGGPPKRLDTNAVAFDESPNFGGGELKVSIAINVNVDDRLGIRDGGTNAAQIGMSGANVTYGGLIIGTFVAGSGTTPLTVTFNTNASSLSVQALVRNLTYQNVSSVAAVSSRVLQFTLTDGDGGTNSPTFQTLNLICPQGVDAMLVIDVSNSLGTDEFVEAKKAASNFVNHLNLSIDRVGLVSFASNAFLNLPLTNDGALVKSMIMGLTNHGGTRFAPPLDLSRTNLTNVTQAASNVLPLLVLLSDGQSGGPGNFYTNRVEATNACLAVKDAGIRLISIAYGDEGDENGGTNLMKWFASSPSDFYYAPSTNEMQSIYNSIAQGLCRGSNAAPFVTITQPTNGVSYQSTANVSISALAWDLDGSVTNVEFYSASTKIGQDATAPYTVLWTGVTPGEYSLTARAFDDWGRSTTSSVVNISVLDPRSRTWTRNVDFAEGSLLNVNFDTVPHQLQLNQNITPYPYVYIACSARGTLVRIDANTGQILGEYRTAPTNIVGNPNPSRTTVDRFGNVWVANRDDQFQSKGSVTRIGLIIGGTRHRKEGSNYIPDQNGEYLKPPFHYNTCQDRDGDTYIRTSRGLGNILLWSNTNSVDSAGGVTTAEDEAIINYTRVVGIGTRTVAVDADNDVWVGGDYNSAHEKLSGITGLPIPGTQIQTNPPVDRAGGYGGLIDANGSLWSTLNGPPSNLLRYDPGSNNIVNLGASAGTYAIGIDPNTGYIWLTTAEGGIYVRHPNGTVLTNILPSAGGGKGIAVDARGNVWVAHGNLVSGELKTTISHYRTDGTYIGRVVLPCGEFPTGVAIDSNGKVWIANGGTVNAMRIDPNGGPRLLNGALNTNGFPIGVVDLTVDLGSGAGPYNYSDMTGYVSLGSTAPAGVWTVTHDSGTNGTSWGTAKWTAYEPADTKIRVEVRAADTLAAQTNAFGVVTNGSTFSGQGVAGRYIEIRATLLRNFGATNFPVLYDLSIAPGTTQPAIATNAPYLANDDTFVVTRNSSTSTLPVLANDADPAGYSLGIWKSSAPMSGTISNTGSALLYRPNTNFFGKDRCIYWVTNGQGGVDRALVTIYVDHLDIGTTNFPIANDDFVTVIPNDVDTNIVVLTNDVNASRIVYVSQPRYGSNVLDTATSCVGQIKYTPPRLYLGSDSFVYAVVDTNGVSRWATVYINVAGEAPRPIVCGQTLHGELSTNDSRIPLVPTVTGDVYTFEGVAGSNVTFYAIGQVSYVTIVSPTGVLLASSSEVLPGVQGVGFTLTNSGMHWVQVSTLAALPVTYDIKFQCDSSYPPEITALETGRPLTNNATLDFGITDMNTTLSRTVSVQNAGPISILILSNVAVTSPFFLTNVVSGTELTNGGATNIVISYTPLDYGGSTGTLTITNNDGGGADGVENPFVLNLKAYANTVFPTVTITNPQNGELVYAGSDLRISVSATPYTGAVTQALFYASNAIVGLFQIGSDTNSPYEILWPNVSLGTYTLYARATDSGGFVGESAPVNIYVVTNLANHPPVAYDDEFTIAMNSSNNVLHVLANDYDPDGNALSVRTNGYVPGTITNAGTHFIYTPPAYTTGSVNFGYTVNDGWGGKARGVVTLNVMEIPPPTISITNPAENANFTLPATITINASVSGSVSKVAFYADEEKIGEAASPYSLSWTEGIPGSVRLRAFALSTEGWIASAPITIFVNPKPGNQLPIARIDNLSVTVSNVPAGVFTTNYPIVRDGLFAVQGTADDPDGADTVSYQLRVLSLDGTILRAFTNQARVASSTLATLDLSTLRNGVYDLELRVRDGGDISIVRKRFILDSELKIGQFSFSEQDVVIPVNGIPLTVVRTYNSLNPDIGDFGVGWTYAINDLEVQLDEDRGWNQDVSDEVFSQRIGGGRNVTLTLPDGRRTTFSYYLRQGGSECSGCYQAFWQAPPGVYATLTTLDSATTNLNTLADNTLITSWGIPYWYRSAAGPYTPLEAFDFAGFALTLQDGTRYEIERESQGPFYSVDDEGNDLMVEPRGKPTLKRIVQRSNDRIEIGANRIDHYTPSNQITRSVWIERQDNGRITAIRDPVSGSDGTPVVKYEYDALGNLSAVLRLVDRITSSYLTNRYFYTNATFPHYLTGMEDTRGITVARNEFYDDGKLKRHIDADGKTIEYVHNTTNRMEVITDSLTNSTTLVYDLRGNVIATTNALGHPMFYAYDTNNNRIAETNALGEWTHSTYDANGFLLGTTNALNQTNVFTYNPQGQLLASIDALGRGVTNEYNDKGTLTNTVDALGNATRYLYDGNGRLLSQKDAVGNTVTNRYDSLGNVTNTSTLDAQDVELTRTGYSYDANGNRISQTAKRTLKGGGIELAATTLVYDGQNRLTQTIEPDGKTNIVVYDPNGKQKQTVDKLGRITSYDYDSRGNLWRTTYPDLTTETGAFDSEGRRIFSTNRLYHVTQYAYDKLGRLTHTILPDNATNITIYDAAGRVTHTIDARGTTNAFGYDAAGRRTFVTNACGTLVEQVMSYKYDANGNLTNMVDAATRTIDYEYDLLNRRVKTIFPATVSGGTRPYTLTGYDGLGRRIAETNEAGIVSRFGYDGAGRLIATTNAWNTPDATWVTYAYDERGNQTNQVDALNRSTKYEYDTLGRRIKRTLPGNQWETFGYDAGGNLLAHTNFNGLVITNLYNSMNQLVKKSAGSTVLETYAYDVAGRLTNRTDASGVWLWVYDNRDRLKTNAGPVGNLHYQYDLAGNLTNLTSSTSGGTSIDYHYDALSRLTNVVDQRLTGTKNTVYSYDGIGNLAALKYPNGVTNVWQYDARNRLTNAVWKLNASPLATFYYRLGVAGNRTNLDETLPSVTRAYAWSYDQSYRLTNEIVTGSAPTGTVSYEYDLVSNRTNRSSTLAGVTNHALSYNTNDWLTIDGYDNNGNTTNSAANSYQYDYANRITNSGAVVIVYDADGNRIKKVAGGTTTLYLVDTRNLTGYRQVLEELTVGGTTNLSKAYTYGLDLISQREPNISTNFFGYDGIGSTRLLTDSGGTVVNAFAYDAYGTLIASNTAPQSAYLFAGEQWDSDLKFYFLRARYLKADTGRFWSADTHEGIQEEPISLHRYLYCGADPVNHLDPSGNSFLPQVLITFAQVLYVRTVVFVATRPVLAKLAGVILGLVVATQIDTTGFQGVPQLQGVSALQAAEVKFLDAIKRGPIYNSLTKELKGFLSRETGLAFQNFLYRTVFKDALELNKQVSNITKHEVDFVMHYALAEAKHTLRIDAAQLNTIAKFAKDEGKQLWYVFVKKPGRAVIDRIKKAGGSVGWFLDDTD